MKRKPLLVYACLSLLLISALPAQSLGWGPGGHRIVAMVASNYLSDKAKEKIADLLGDETVVSVANWADAVRGTRPETAEWHFVDIPITSHDTPSQHCPNHDCVIGAIQAQRAILMDSSKPKKARAEALKFIIHFVGDMHQPLHCADNDDRGGNNVIVKFFGKRSKLHAVWDSGIINEADLPDSEFADELLANLENATPQQIVAMQKGSLEDWAMESHKLAKSNAYKIPANKVLGAGYYNTNWQVVDTQLTRAGLRLARILNEIFQ